MDIYTRGYTRSKVIKGQLNNIACFVRTEGWLEGLGGGAGAAGPGRARADFPGAGATEGTGAGARLSQPISRTKFGACAQAYCLIPEPPAKRTPCDVNIRERADFRRLA